VNRSVFPWSAAARRMLTLHLQRLGNFFSNLARGLRERLAAAAGEAVTAVFRALLDSAEVPYRTPGYYDPDVPSWRYEAEESWRDDPAEEYDSEVPEHSPPQPHGRWRPTLAAALQATAWWLRQPTAGVPGKLAVAASLAAGLATWAGMPVAGVLALAGTVPGLIVLADAARDGVEALSQQTIP
jgi:hypothetical protein